MSWILTGWVKMTPGNDSATPRPSHVVERSKLVEPRGRPMMGAKAQCLTRIYEWQLGLAGVGGEAPGQLRLWDGHWIALK